MNQSIPASPKAPITITSPQRLKLLIQNQRQTINHQTLQCAQLQEQIEEMQTQLHRSSCVINEELQNDIDDIFKGVYFYVLNVLLFAFKFLTFLIINIVLFRYYYR